MNKPTSNTTSNEKVVSAAVELINEIVNDYKEDINEYPDFLLWDWKDINVLKKYDSILISILAYNAFYPNLEIIKKLKDSRRTSSISKWAIGMEPIIDELERLGKKYPEIHMDAFAYYTFMFINMKTRTSFLKAINEDKSEVFLDELPKRYFLQSRKSPKSTKKGVKKLGELGNTFNKGLKENNIKAELTTFLKDEKNPIDSLLKMIIQSQVANTTAIMGRKKAIKKWVGVMQVDPYTYMRLLPIDELEKNYPKNALYRDLFPLFKLILKNKTLLSEEEHKLDRQDTYYNIYKVNQVKIILGKTRKGN
jgi:hypothetical protein